MNVSRNQLYDYPGNCHRDNSVLDDVVGFDGAVTAEPITVQEAKDFCLIDTDAYDADISEFITVARKVIEKYLGVCICPRELTAYLNNSLGGIELPYGPVIEVISVKNVDGTEFSEDEIDVQGLLFKTLESPIGNKLTVTYNAGHEVMLPEFRQAVKRQVLFMFENRGDQGSADTGQISPQAKDLVQRMRRVGNEFFI